MAPSKSAPVPSTQVTKRDKRLKPKKTKSTKSSSSMSSEGSHSNRHASGKKSKKDDQETGGLKLLKRHTVTMPRISKRKSLRQKKTVLFNRKGTPYGKVAKEMQSYIGVLARRKIPIIRPTWRDVTDEEKDKFFKRVQVYSYICIMYVVVNVAGCS